MRVGNSCVCVYGGRGGVRTDASMAQTLTATEPKGRGAMMPLHADTRSARGGSCTNGRQMGASRTKMKSIKLDEGGGVSFGPTWSFVGSISLRHFA